MPPQVPFKFNFGAPSCVPATTFETAGAEITVAEVEQLLDDPRIRYLSEMMNFPGILYGDPGCLAKVKAAHDRGKRVDGHAPGLRGEQAAKYIAAGITTDHECFTKEEALDKLAAGCKISIREGSAARNFDALYTLLGEFPGQTMLCSDDKHPDELLVGHINLLVRRAVERGIDVYDVLRAACLVPIEHYGLDVGQLRVGDPADFIEVDSLTAFNVLRTWIDGQLVAEGGKTKIPQVDVPVVNKFVPTKLSAADIAVSAPADDTEKLQVIEALDGQLITNRLEVPVQILHEAIHYNLDMDVLKLVVVNRYYKAPPAVAYIKNFGLKRGAMASSVAHDSHNVIAVGVDDDDIVAAVNLVMECRRRTLGRLCRRQSERSAAAAGRRADGDRHLRRSRRGLRQARRARQAVGLAVAGALHDALVHGLARDPGAQAQRSRPVRRRQIRVHAASGLSDKLRDRAPVFDEPSPGRDTGLRWPAGRRVRVGWRGSDRATIRPTFRPSRRRRVVGRAVRRRCRRPFPKSCRGQVAPPGRRSPWPPTPAGPSIRGRRSAC